VDSLAPAAAAYYARHAFRFSALLAPRPDYLHGARAKQGKLIGGRETPLLLNAMLASNSE
jgi:hypothetical protein